MRKHIRVPALVTGFVAAAMLAGCATSQYPVSQTYPGTYPSTSYPVAGTEFGRIVNIEYLPVGSVAPRNSGILGAVVGGVAGALLGSTIGGGTGRAAATVLGGVAGAAVGNNVQRRQDGVLTTPGYRIVVQTDQGAVRTYEVPAAGDLRIGERVRVDNGVIYRA